MIQFSGTLPKESCMHFMHVQARDVRELMCATIARFARPSLITDGYVYKTLRNERALTNWKQLGEHPLTFSRMVRRYIGGRSGTQYKQHGGLIRSACNNNIANAYCVFIECMQCWRLFGRARNALEIRRQCRGQNDWMLGMTRKSLHHRTHVKGSLTVDDSRVMGSKKYSCCGQESKFLTISARPNCDSQQNDSCHGSDDDSHVIESQKDSCHGIRRWLTCQQDHSSIIMRWLTRHNYIQLI